MVKDDDQKTVGSSVADESVDARSVENVGGEDAQSASDARPRMSKSSGADSQQQQPPSRPPSQPASLRDDDDVAAAETATEELPEQQTSADDLHTLDEELVDRISMLATHAVYVAR